MVSNSKLTKAQRAERKVFLANLPHGATLGNNGYELTVLVVPDGKVSRVFSSVMSDTETKFRRKVGEYHAMRRFFDDANGGMILSGKFWAATDIIGAI